MEFMALSLLVNRKEGTLRKGSLALGSIQPDPFKPARKYASALANAPIGILASRDDLDKRPAPVPVDHKPPDIPPAVPSAMDFDD